MLWSLGCLVPPALAVVATLVRWMIQGRGNVYTYVTSPYYLADRDVGSRMIEDGPVSIGLDAIVALSCYAVALLIGAMVLRRWERRRGAPLPIPRAVHWGLALIPLLVPAWAFASGSFPPGASFTPPVGLVEAPADSITGSLAGLPAGTYQVTPHAGTSLTARLKAGGEAFDARFARDIEGTWRGAPADLRQPMSADISVATAAVDTGIELRTKHAREEYLHGGQHPRIGFHLDRLLGAGPAPGGGVAYRAEGTVALMGKRHPVAVTGALLPTDEAARRRLGFAPTDAVFRATAHFELKIHETGLASDAGDFDGDVIPIEVSLVLRRQADHAP